MFGMDVEKMFGRCLRRHRTFLHKDELLGILYADIDADVVT
jgi:hypothetical protein